MTDDPWAPYCETCQSGGHVVPPPHRMAAPAWRHPRLGVAGLREKWDPKNVPEPEHPEFTALGIPVSTSLDEAFSLGYHNGEADERSRRGGLQLHREALAYLMRVSLVEVDEWARRLLEARDRAAVAKGLTPP